MSTRSRRLVQLYLVLLLALAALGATNQRLFYRQWELINQKAALQLTASDLRREAAAVEGPLAIRSWAVARGMVPAPQVPETFVPASTPPTVTLPESGLELLTLWR